MRTEAVKSGKLAAMHSTVLLVATLLASAGCEKIVEPTFMNVCEDLDGVFHYAPNGGDIECPTGATTILWPSTPLNTFVHYDAETIDFEADIDAAFDLWNDVAPLFIETDDLSEAVVEIQFGSIGDEFAFAKHETIDGQLHGFAVCNECALVGQTYLAIAHELGHVVGLAHDPQTISIMYDELPDTLDDPNPVKLVTDKDTKALRERYGD